MTHNSSPCFCCSKALFSDCCKPVLADHSKALTALALMRSRYTAYVLLDEEYLLTTWDPATRPKKLNLKENPVKWLALTIHSSVDTTESGEVDFSAEFIEQDHLCEIREASNFSRKSGLWYYFDGVNELNKKKIGRNSPCPCSSGKKFKRCCLK